MGWFRPGDCCFIISELLSMLFNMISFRNSQKGCPMLIKNNYIFKYNKTVGETKYYRCKNTSCSVTLHTDLNDVMSKFTGEHSHLPEREEIQIRKFKKAVKQHAKNETTPISQIYDEESIRLDLPKLSIAALPSENKMRESANDFLSSQKLFLGSTLNKARRLQTLAIPGSQIFEIPESYTKTLKDLGFLCIDESIKRKTRMLVFASDEHLKLFNEIRQQLNEIIISLIKQHGFKDFNLECVFVLESCLFDVYQDLLIRFKQHMESLGSSMTIQDALEQTLNEIMSSNLQDLYDYMKEQH
ncbi:hypothetical protein I4U23_029193 [Adineta vaga]|nr:hypothetical protein I4U23_029193 [Adineta vaga]